MRLRFYVMVDEMELGEDEAIEEEAVKSEAERLGFSRASFFFDVIVRSRSYIFEKKIDE